jgi:quinol monooxygenase YgiN
MIIASIVFAFAPQDADEAEAMLRELRDASLKEPGIIRFEVGRSHEKPHVFALWEVYRDQDAVNAHRSTEHFQRLVVDGIRPLAQQRNVETVIPI